MGFGKLNFVGEKEFEGNYYPNYASTLMEEKLAYTYTEFRVGYEIILDRVIRFDIYPIQFTYHSLSANATFDHQFIPAIGVTKNGHFNPGMGVHIVLNQIKGKKL
ncbi:MAG: hypothetical protein ACI9JN_000678 [Bacteroidia bacterium]|jgi:hypothetical protein